MGEAIRRRRIASYYFEFAEGDAAAFPCIGEQYAIAGRDYRRIGEFGWRGIGRRRFVFDYVRLAPAFAVVVRHEQRERRAGCPVAGRGVSGEDYAAVVKPHAVDAAVVIGKRCRHNLRPADAAVA